MQTIVTEISSMFASPWTWGEICVGVVILVFVGRIFWLAFSVTREERPGPPVTKGQLHLFDDDGQGHFLSAKMPTKGLEQLLKDLNRGRFG
jgi:hypothetical protein